MLLGLNQSYGITDAKIIENWIVKGQGYEEPISFSDDESERGSQPQNSHPESERAHPSGLKRNPFVTVSRMLLIKSNQTS